MFTGILLSSKKLIKEMDWLFFGLLLIILTVNLYFLSGASANVVPGDPTYYFRRQLTWALVSLPVFFVVASIDYHHLRRFSRLFYVLAIILLVLVLFTTGSVSRWFHFGSFYVQPSELAKLAVILALASFLFRRGGKITSFKDIILSVLLVAIPAALILIEPDLGTAVVFLMVFLTMMFLGGLRLRIFLIALLILVLLAVGLFMILGDATQGFTQQALEENIPNFLPLQGYQITRLVIFINPYMDPLGSGYHIIQSKIAIGAGGLWGKGYAQGTQVQGNFLPAHHTDFIFAAVGEEFGFVGTVGLLALYFFLLLVIIRIALQAKESFGALLSGGIAAMFFFQVLINVGMNIGILPVTGLTMPLLSYGGSSLMVMMMAFGLVLSVRIHRKDRLFD